MVEPWTPVMPRLMTASNSSSSTTLRALKALFAAFRFTARRTHSGLRCTQAPRPVLRRCGSGTTRALPGFRTSRKRTAWSSVSLHPIQVRMGLREEPLFTTDSHPPPRIWAQQTELLTCLVYRALTRWRDNVDSPARELGRKTSVLPLLADRKRELIVRDNSADVV